MPGIRRNNRNIQRIVAQHQRRRLFLFYFVMQMQVGIREIWVHPLNEERASKGEFYVLYPDLRKWDSKFFCIYRMSVAQFDNLLRRLAPRLKKQDTNFRPAISPEHQLVLTLSYLASGDSFNGLAARFRLGVSTVSTTIRRACNIIWEVLQPTEMPVPSMDDWKVIEHRFSTKWNFPNCIGALDGKHVAIKAPANTGSNHFNYKGHFSVVLLALVDADYRFICVDIGQYGSLPDGNIFKNSAFGKKFMNDRLNVPPPKSLPNFRPDVEVPHCIIADEAFPLRTDLLRPYPRGRQMKRLPRWIQMYNYRVCRARRMVENAFGILVQRWRIYDRRINVSVEGVDAVIKATVVLNNYLCDLREVAQIYADLNPDNQPYLQNNGAIHNLYIPQAARSGAAARQNREFFADYFNSREGSIPWQGARFH